MLGICWFNLFHKEVKSSFSKTLDIIKPTPKRSTVLTDASPGLTVRFFLGVNIGVL
jgi:hypothetical protein